MQLRLSEEHQQIRDMIRDFVQAEVSPAACEAWEAEGVIPEAMFKTLAELGMMGVLAPEEAGGAGMDLLALSLCVEALAGGDAALAWTVARHNALVVGHLLRGGGHASWVQRLTAGGLRGAWACDEADDLDQASMGTAAVEAEGAWRIDGHKAAVPQAHLADVFVVVARTDAPGGLTAFVVPADAEGLTVGPARETLGLRAGGFADVRLDGVRLPGSAVVGAVGGALGDRDALMAVMRTLGAAMAVGVGTAAMEAGGRYAMVREQFGQPIARFQAIQHKLADMAVELDAARLLTHRAAWALEAGARGAASQAAMAKLMAGEAARRAADEALQIHGGYGYTTDYPVERYWRDARLCTLTAGDSEVQRSDIAAAVLA